MVFISYKRNKQRAHKMPIKQPQPQPQPQPQSQSQYPKVSNVRFTTKPTNGSNIIDTQTQSKEY